MAEASLTNVIPDPPADPITAVGVVTSQSKAPAHYHVVSTSVVLKHKELIQVLNTVYPHCAYSIAHLNVDQLIRGVESLGATSDN